MSQVVAFNDQERVLVASCRAVLEKQHKQLAQYLDDRVADLHSLAGIITRSASRVLNRSSHVSMGIESLFRSRPTKFSTRSACGPFDPFMFKGNPTTRRSARVSAQIATTDSAASASVLQWATRSGVERMPDGSLTANPRRLPP